MDYELLHEISLIDREIMCIKREKALKELGKKLSLLRAEYNAFKSEYESIAGQIKLLSMQTGTGTIGIETLLKDLKAHEKSLYESSSLKAFETHQRCIERINEDIRKNEEEVYKFLQEIEILEKQKKDIIINSKEIRVKYDALKKQYEDEERVKTARIQALMVRRDELMNDVTEAGRSEYEIGYKETGYGMSEVNGEICSGCGISVPSIIIYQVKNNKTLTRCNNCGRLLYVNI